MNSLLINGEWQQGKAGLFSSFNPATNETLWQSKEPSPEQVDAAVSSARQAFKQWMWTPYDERVSIINNFANQIEKNAKLIAETISKEVGKPSWEAMTEVKAMIAKAKISQHAYQARTGIQQQSLGHIQGITQHKPHGVFVVLGPFNFPGHLSNGHIIPALLAGNTVVFKPSQLAPLTAEIVVQCWLSAGLPPGVLNLVQGTDIIGQKLISNLNINGVLFTGSYQTGLKIHKQFANRPDMMVALEMGGNNPLVVWDVNDIKAAAYHTVVSAFITTGQRCTCARRLIVPNTAAGEQFVDALLALMTKLKVGIYSDNPEPFMGPLITKKAAQYSLSAQDELIKQGAKVLAPMEQLLPDNGLVTPALLDVTEIDERYDRELFGPLLQCIRVDSFEQAILEANHTHYGLSAGLFTEDEKLFRQFYQDINAGIINWNQQLTGASSAQPFGGIGFSGNHRPSAYYAADYCAYPVASLQSTTLTIPGHPLPGIFQQ